MSAIILVGLLPAASCSAMVRRMSSASSACDSATDWFWHTAQRNCSAISSTCRWRGSSLTVSAHAHGSHKTTSTNHRPRIS